MGKTYTCIASSPNLVAIFFLFFFFFNIKIMIVWISDIQEQLELVYWSAQSPKMSFFLRSISAKSNSVPVIRL